MPVILEPDQIEAWIEPNGSWTTALQEMCKPYSGELVTYQVSKDVGKVGNDSPSFVMPLDSRNSIANFFGGSNKPTSNGRPGQPGSGVDSIVKQEVKVEDAPVLSAHPATPTTPLKPPPDWVVVKTEDGSSPGSSSKRPRPDEETDFADAPKTPKTPRTRIEEKSPSKSSPSCRSGGDRRADPASKKITSFFKPST